MANGGADASQGEGWWQASDGKWYPPQTASPSIPPPPPPQTPSSPPVEDDGGDGSDKPPFWRRRWVLITGGILIVITALTDTSGDDESDTATGDEPAAAEDEPDESGETSTTSSTSPSSSTTTTTIVPAGGTRDNPHAFESPTAVRFDTFGDADGSVWSITVGMPEDVTDAVLAENQFNDAPPEGVRFVGFDVRTQLLEARKVPLSAGFNLTWELLGGSSSAVYDATGCGVTPGAYNDFAEVFVGGELNGLVCVPLPVEDLGHSKTQVAINFSGGDRVIFGLNGTEAPTPQDPAIDQSIAVGAGQGDRQSPYPFGTPTDVSFETLGDADGSVWSVTITELTDITDQVLAENQFNDAPPDGVAFVGFRAEMTLVSAGKEPLSPGFNLSWEILGGATHAVYVHRNHEFGFFVQRYPRRVRRFQRSVHWRDHCWNRVHPVAYPGPRPPRNAGGD